MIATWGNVLMIRQWFPNGVWLGYSRTSFLWKWFLFNNNYSKINPLMICFLRYVEDSGSERTMGKGDQVTKWAQSETKENRNRKTMRFPPKIEKLIERKRTLWKMKRMKEHWWIDEKPSNKNQRKAPRKFRRSVKQISIKFIR